jgi:CheY-like chemotaxis protein
LGECLRITVADTGIGVLPKDHRRIFSEFEQVDSSYGRQQQGTGLGLALTQRLVELHKGRIWVESEGVEGQGSRFTCLIPLAKAEAKLHSATDGGPRTNEVLRPLILLASEEEDSQRQASHCLEEAGYEVAVVPDISQLNATLKRNRPYAVVIDDKLTRQRGTGELRHLRAQIPGSIPAVTWSATADAAARFRLFTVEPAAAARTASRLTDTIRHNVNPSAKEVKTVLVIEDEPALLELLAKTLLFKGFRVLPAATGYRGIELATEAKPDVIILDISMPDCTGIQVVEQLRGRPDTKHIPILIHTGIALNEQERQHLAAHVQSITSKTEPETLFADLDRLNNLPA